MKTNWQEVSNELRIISIVSEEREVQKMMRDAQEAANPKPVPQSELWSSVSRLDLRVY